jgi:hypothetical protein
MLAMVKRFLLKSGGLAKKQIYKKLKMKWEIDLI